jgi:hypothetical protein
VAALGGIALLGIGIWWVVGRSAASGSEPGRYDSMIDLASRNGMPVPLASMARDSLAVLGDEGFPFFFARYVETLERSAPDSGDPRDDLRYRKLMLAFGLQP